MGAMFKDNEVEPFQKRFWLLVAVIVLAAGVLVWRLYYLQIVEGARLAELSMENYVQSRILHAQRGRILDRNGKVLVDNHARLDVYLTPAFCKNVEKTLSLLEEFLNLRASRVDALRSAIKRARGLDRFLPLAVQQDISRKSLGLLKFHQEDLEGVDVIPTPHRRYRQGDFASHVLGSMNEIGAAELASLKARGLDYRQGDYIGRTGVERSFEKYLRGRDGEGRVVVDARGTPMPEKISRLLVPKPVRQEPLPGHDVQLTLDWKLQQAAEDALKSGSLAGAVVVMDPRNGDVLAMASNPSYDPNQLMGRNSSAYHRKLDENDRKPRLNRAIQSVYPPGSTYKAITALAGLETGVLSETSSAVCPGYVMYGNRPFHCHKESGHGPVMLRTALQVSCDVYFYRAGEVLTMDRMAAYAHKLGYGELTGIQLDHERAGIVPTPAIHKRIHGFYSRGFDLITAIGQGAVSATALQLAVSYSAIANGGTVYRPNIVRRVTAHDGKVVKEYPPVLWHEKIAKPENIRLVKEGLAAVVMEWGGTARRHVYLEGVPIAGKTGTAQVISKKIKTEELPWIHRDHALFVAFSPVENPEITVAVINEHGGHGGSDAGPIARAIIKRYWEEYKGYVEPPQPDRQTRAPNALPAAALHGPGDSHGD
ncbi:MAG: Peptidoglycan D,D-transpeptidase MrdA [Myxococcota bacterium]|nr:Peptidoglycan D,D-transpeptidase MrdA [Myxococcota bacterium]